ncbi:ATP-binding protein [Chelatococcus sp. SYSU_G07232]|uniref:histidine kinase n=1 Tax=Chelatococcus albus TaxID=3047466 RepID=A0ABT7AJ39_9HYPH|nr:ATP-binding protein [Chelatococcus sp. SYSU_G07232]MDJ1159007.1 ATP-binding protein [Chelatococcus sp. SYSU_G07232]
MTALGKLLRTTAFKLSVAYLVVFVLFAGFILGYVAWNARRVLDDQIMGTVEAEITGLAEQYRIGGIRRLVGVIDRRTREPSASLYLVTTFSGERLAGNVGALPAGVLDDPGIRETDYRRNDETDPVPRRALVRVFVLQGGFRLLVGRDVEERERLGQVIRRALGLSLGLVTVLACLGGWFVTRRVLKRVDAMTDTTRTIMAGDLDGRLAIAGTGDELDRLAQNLNAMLDRIGELMAGMKEVSDNIAHDLKTPLTRLRNRAEEALRTAKTPEDYARALESTIEESDNLIRIFNALLMIARLEAGNAAQPMEDFDAAEVARGVAELYEALAEEAGTPLAVEVADDLPVHGSRELIGQALANLLDNALKYGAAEDGMNEPTPVAVVAGRNANRVEIAVTDRGPGIPEGERGRVLERFARLEGARSKPGFGLGLSLAAAVARLHGGELRLEDNAPGLRAVLSLPLKAGAAA